MLYEVLSDWKQIYPGAPLDRMGIVFHTSCVNYDMEDLERLLELNPFWILPDNVYWELRLLQDSEQFREKARFLLTHARHEQDPSRRWDLEQTSKSCAAPVNPVRLYRRELLFLFGDLNRQDEFLSQARPEEGMYILLCDEWGRKKGQYTNVYLLRDVADYQMRQAVQLDKTHPRSEAFDKIQELFTCMDRNGVPLSGGDFHLVKGMSGRFACVYRCGHFAGRLVKGYRNFNAVGSRQDKLRLLSAMGTTKPAVSRLPLALPENLLFGRVGCAGYTMRQCRGKQVFEIVRSKSHWENYTERVFKNLFLLLLELHTRHILVNDLSLTNILVDEDDRVSIVDCDSFQVLGYPGQDYPKGWLHPELEKADLLKELRSQRHEHFALAIFLFWCLFLCPPVWCGDGVMDWSQGFPLDADGVRDGAPVNRELSSMWMKITPEQRRAFSDEFLFRRDLSIGAWIRLLKLDTCIPPVR